MINTSNYSYKHRGKQIGQEQRYQARQARRQSTRRAKQMEKLATRVPGVKSPEEGIPQLSDSLDFDSISIRQIPTARTGKGSHANSISSSCNRNMKAMAWLLTLIFAAFVAIPAASTAPQTYGNMPPAPFSYGEQPTTQNGTLFSQLTPDLHPDFFSHQNSPGFNDGNNEPLSSLDTISRKMKGQFSELQTPDFSLLGTQEGQFVDDTAVFVTKHAEETTKLRAKMIMEAKQSIEISGNFGGGEIFMQTLKTLDEALTVNPAVKIHLLFSTDFILDEESKGLADLASKYPGRVHYQLSNRHNALPGTVENHVKLTVIDGKYAIIGGTGITDNFVTIGTEAPPPKEKKTWAEYVIPTGARDQDNIIRGSLAKKARAEFFKLLKKWEGIETDASAPLRWFPIDNQQAASIKEIDESERLEKSVTSRLLTCGPEQEINPCTKMVEELILHGEKELVIAHMYQNYVREIDVALNEVLEKGKAKVTIITNKYWGNSPLRNAIMFSTFDDLRGPNLFRYYYDVPETLYHKKIFSSNSGKQTCYANGSYNLGKKSHFSDDEIMFVFCKPNGDSNVAGNDVMEGLKEDMALSIIDETAQQIDVIADRKIFIDREIKRAGGLRAFVRILAQGLLPQAREMIGSLLV